MNIVSNATARKTWQEKEGKKKKSIQMGKEEIKLSLYPQDDGDRGVKTEEYRVSLAGKWNIPKFGYDDDSTYM